MNLPGRMDTQKALLRDYGRYVERFGEVTGYLKGGQLPALMLWGRHDAFFLIAETVSWMEELPRMEAHIFDAGHLLLETHSAAVTPLVREFVRRNSEGSPSEQVEQLCHDGDRRRDGRPRNSAKSRPKC